MTQEKREKIKQSIIDSQAWFENEVTKACKDVQVRFVHEPMSFYLHHKLGGLAFFSEMEGTLTGWELSDPRAFQGYQTYEQLRAIVWGIARRLPCLPPLDAALLSNNRQSGLPVKSKVSK